MNNNYDKAIDLLNKIVNNAERECSRQCVGDGTDDDPDVWIDYLEVPKEYIDEVKLFLKDIT